MIEYLTVKLYDSMFIGHSVSSTILDFYGNDNIPFYEKNVKNLPDDWYYKKNNLTYKFNSLGHRCDEPTEINFNNYILFLGDSHPVGMGLELENTYPYLVSKLLDCSYYNLSVGGTGPEIMYHNLICWLSKYPKPKYISCYWSDPTRFLTQLDTNDNNQIMFSINGRWSEDYPIVDFYKYGELSNYFNTRFLLNLIGIKKYLENYNVPYSYVSFLPKEFIDLEKYNIKQVHANDKARDNMHAGIESNKQIADYIVSDYSDKYMNATIHSTT